MSMTPAGRVRFKAPPFCRMARTYALERALARWGMSQPLRAPPARETFARQRTHEYSQAHARRADPPGRAFLDSGRDPRGRARGAAMDQVTQAPAPAASA